MKEDYCYQIITHITTIQYIKTKQYWCKNRQINRIIESHNKKQKL